MSWSSFSDMQQDRNGIGALPSYPENRGCNPKTKDDCRHCHNIGCMGSPELFGYNNAENKIAKNKKRR